MEQYKVTMQVKDITPLLMHPHPVIIELGMCDGYHSNLMLEQLHSLNKPYTYHGVEPVKHLYDRIHLKYAGQKHNIAIASENGELDLHVSGGSHPQHGSYYGSSSIRSPKLVTQAWERMTFTTQRCTAMTFDTFIESIGLKDKRIDFIWADIQGAEIDLINGGQQALKHTRYLYTEYNNSELYEGCLDLNGILALLPDWELVHDYNGDALLINTLL